MKFTFGDIVVNKDNEIGVVVKSWLGKTPNHDVYVRMHNGITNYTEGEIERYMVRHKYLDETEQEYQYNAINNL